MTIRTQNTCPLMTGFLLCCAMAMFATISLGQPQNRTARASGSIPKADLIQIIKAEDERRWDNDLRSLLSNKNSAIRSRAALTAGRIGQEDAVSELTKLLQQDANPDVRAMAAFAIGEIEAEAGAPALLLVLQDRSAPGELRARSLEALGKIAGALPKD